MATWEDGPEYAPRQRPEAFVGTATAPLSQADPAPPAPPPPPGDTPTFAAPQEAQPQLAGLAPVAVQSRNPAEPFETLTVAGNWSGESAPSGERNPTEPFAGPGPSLTGYLPAIPSVQPNALVNPAPFPTHSAPDPAAPLAAPPLWSQPAPPPTGPKAVFETMTPAVIIVLVLGVTIFPIAVLMLAVAFFLSGRIACSQTAIRTGFLIGLFVMAIGMMVSLPVYQPSLFDAWNSLNIGAAWACFLLLPILYAIVGAQLRSGQAEQRRP